MKQKGFTLIELLVAVAIISILAAIAITNFARYKTNSLNATAKSDLRIGITAQEAYYADFETYTTCADAGACEGVLEGFVASKDDGATPVITPYNFVGDAAGFVGEARHTRGDTTYTYDSTVGSFQES